MCCHFHGQCASTCACSGLVPARVTVHSTLCPWMSLTSVACVPATWLGKQAIRWSSLIPGSLCCPTLLELADVYCVPAPVPLALCSNSSGDPRIILPPTLRAAQTEDTVGLPFSYMPQSGTKPSSLPCLACTPFLALLMFGIRNKEGGSQLCLASCGSGEEKVALFFRAQGR